MAEAPLVLPSWLEFTEFKMRLVGTKDVSQLEGRRTETASFGTPYWSVLEARTGYLDPQRIDDIETFFHQAQKGGATFVCNDFFNLRPRAYANNTLASLGLVKAVGGAAFDGNAVLSSITSSTQITVSGLPNGFVINRGALFEVRKSALVRSLHRVTVAVTSGATGTAVLKFESPLDTGVFGLPNTIHFEKPSCVMMLRDFDMPRSHGDRYATFSATEAFFS